MATLVQRVTFELVPGQQIAPEPLITLRPKRGIRVVVRRKVFGRGAQGSQQGFDRALHSHLDVVMVRSSKAECYP